MPLGKPQIFQNNPKNGVWCKILRIQNPKCSSFSWRKIPNSFIKARAGSHKQEGWDSIDTIHALTVSWAGIPLKGSKDGIFDICIRKDSDNWG